LAIDGNIAIASTGRVAQDDEDLAADVNILEVVVGEVLALGLHAVAGEDEGDVLVGARGGDAHRMEVGALAKGDLLAERATQGDGGGTDEVRAGNRERLEVTAVLASGRQASLLELAR